MQKKPQGWAEVMTFIKTFILNLNIEISFLKLVAFPAQIRTLHYPLVNLGATLI